MINTNQPAIISQHEQSKLHLKSYVFGYVLSLVFTLVAYLMVYNHSTSTNSLVIAVVILALSQALVQIYFFLHLGNETKPRWKLYVFGFMLSVVLILVFGSLWIIDNLNYRMTLPQQIQYMNSQDGL